ncbi:VIT1/CCC1 transporter family protein [Pseudarthrobacter sp. CC12]|uniref:VIT1/CCC1 transporter family protein n=1 Tax=Pseudarthrobacter sp. CC12 TaxID=3029193 RepID=UPI00326437A6
MTNFKNTNTRDDSHGGSPSDLRRWRQYLADERAEAAVYRDLAGRRSGEEREILLALAEAETRHEQHWLKMLGDNVGKPRRGGLRTRFVGFLARHFGSVFVLALAQRAEARSPYARDVHATAAMAADEQIHEEIVRALATRGRNRLSGSFRAAVFGANDGLVSNLSLVMGISASGAPNSVVLLSGVAGLLAGALSMGAGEYVSVRSQRELLEASTPNEDAQARLPHLNAGANELALLYRARGMSPEEANAKAAESLQNPPETPIAVPAGHDKHEAVGTGLGAATSSFLFFGSGAILPVLPYLFGLQGITALIIASIIVGLALLTTGAIVALLSGGAPLKMALRQLAIGYGAAAVTYLLGMLFGTSAA